MFGVKYLNDDRASVIDDLKFINTIRNQYASEFLHDGRTFTLDETINWYESSTNKYPDGYWIVERDDGVRVGYVRISQTSLTDKRLMIGADIAPEFCGLGYATVIYKQMLDLMFITNRFNKVSLEVLSTNLRAINLYMKLGFTVEGVKRDEVYRNGAWIDSIIMSILKSEYNG